MTTAADKIKQRADLTSKGYSFTYLKEWQPRVDMWWHRDWLNMEGEVMKPAGTLVPNQPGNPDTQMRLSSRGLLPWPIEDCIPLHAPGCRGCRERAAPVKEVAEALVKSAVTTDGEHVHKYRGRKMGSACATEGCTATRQTAFKKRTQRL